MKENKGIEAPLRITPAASDIRSGLPAKPAACNDRPLRM